LGSQLRACLVGACVATAALLASGCHAAPVADVAVAAQASKAAAVSAARAAAAAGPVVALGDSYTAGALLPFDRHAAAPGCLRSTRAYPVLVAHALGAPLIDVACTSAGIKEMTVAQHTYLHTTNPPQLSALAPDDRLVLLTLSGDDMGFLNVLQECVKLSFTRPWGSPCATHYGGQPDAALSAEAPKIAKLLVTIAHRAPYARVVVVGYPDLFPQSAGCWPAVPITDGDIGYLRAFEARLNAMLAQAARAAGATFVNTYTPTAGRDFCRPESVRDIEGLVPGSLTLPFHPNTRGQAAIAAAVLAAVKPVAG